MTSLKLFLLPIALLAAPLAANADDRYERAPREVYWDGNCRVEQRVNRDGELVERRRCRGDGYAGARSSRDYNDARQPERYAADERDSRSYADAEPQPRRYPEYRDQPRYDLRADQRSNAKRRRCAAQVVRLRQHVR